ncbi:MAG: T9SS type A sorting domain-containing protein, partial [Bacteroidetes bacterium]|nr:T9SS type A sorting domain-containing protein [Bacteroidota bacterium]
SNVIHMVVVPVVHPQVSISANPGTAITQNQGVTFTAMATNAGPSPAYQWLKNAVNIAGATQQSYTSNTLQNGDVIACRVHGLNLCDTATSAPLVMAVWPLSVQQLTGNSEQINVYPNPVKDVLSIDYDKSMNAEMVLCDMAGRVLLRRPLGHSLDMKGLASGVYMLRIRSNTAHLTKLISKQ